MGHAWRASSRGLGLLERSMGQGGACKCQARLVERGGGAIRAGSHYARAKGPPELSDAGAEADSRRSTLPLGRIGVIEGWAMSEGPRRLG